MSKKGRILIVDDSKFSISIITEMLEQNGYEVVGSAMDKAEVQQRVSALKPDLVTMDMTLPGTDGFECTEIIKSIDEDIAVIIVSSLMDDELKKKAARLKVSGYIQKPIEEEELILEVEKALNNKNAFSDLENLYLDIFKESFSDNMKKMTKTTVKFKEAQKKSLMEESRGITVITGIIGLFSGKLIIDISNETAKAMIDSILKKQDSDMDTILNVLSEWVNIIAGNACSMINMKNKAYGLKIAPPTVFYGKSIHISQANLEVSSVDIETQFGIVNMSVGFKGGE